MKKLLGIIIAVFVIVGTFAFSKTVQPTFAGCYSSPQTLNSCTGPYRSGCNCSTWNYCYSSCTMWSCGGLGSCYIGKSKAYSCSQYTVLDTGCYSSSEPCSCCSQITCTCTPTCAAGTSTTVSGSLCSAGNSSCSQSNECSSCTTTGAACYYPETNTTFIQSNGSTSGPTSINIIVDGTTYILSTNPSNPTHIKLPAAGSSNVQMSVPTFTAPATSRGGGYQFIANNYGTNDEWKTWVSCSGTAGEDFCTAVPNTNNTQNFVPTSKTIDQVLKEGATGKISGIYTTTDKCNNTYKYSLPTEGYYVVDSFPTTITPTIEVDTTTNGCTSTAYTGTDINNPLHIVASTSDIDGNSEIQAFILWFSADSSVPATETIASSYTGSINTDLGVMIKKDGASWSNPLIYATNTSQTWGLVTNEYIQINNANIIRIYDISITESTDLIFDYKLEFIKDLNNLSGTYNVYGGALDTYLINGSTLDQSHLVKFFNWGIDLVNPTVNDITQQIQDQTNTKLTWSISDATSGISQAIINGYRVGGTETDRATLFDTNEINKGSIDLLAKPADQEIGKLNDVNAWKFSSNPGETDRLNIGTNEGGKIEIYVTAYDNACNTSAKNEEINLNPWFATRGGSVYSDGNITTIPNDVSGVSTLNGVFNPNTYMDKSLIDLGTELLATRGTNISALIHANQGAAKAISNFDSNSTKSYWFETLLRKFDILKGQLASFSSITSSTSVDCTSGNNCYLYSINPNSDIYIPSNYLCNKPTLFVSERDIYIEPNITSSNSVLSGCIFFARNNIYIGAGSHLSTDGIIRYDYLEGTLIADNQIVFPLVDTAEALRDGVEVFGNIIAMGSNTPAGESAISINRALKLFNQTNPTVVITYDNKYSYISTLFFGIEASIYKQEVGFKSF